MTHTRDAVHDGDADWQPFRYPATVQRRADSLLRLMTHPGTPAAERLAAARRFVMVTGVMPAETADELHEVFPCTGGITVMCRSGGGWADCDPTDPVSVAHGVRECGGVPRYRDGQLWAAYPVQMGAAA